MFSHVVHAILTPYSWKPRKLKRLLFTMTEPSACSWTARLRLLPTAEQADAVPPCFRQAEKLGTYRSKVLCSKRKIEMFSLTDFFEVSVSLIPHQELTRMGDDLTHRHVIVAQISCTAFVAPPVRVPIPLAMSYALLLQSRTLVDGCAVL